jgi:heme/copper-type cytochrome/quinol oxidase subunit 3
MWLFIATEATLFALLFFAYFYLGSSKAEWPREDPSLRLPLVMLGVLLTSSVVLSWGEKGIRRGNVVRLRAGLAATLILGLGFLVIQSIEYAHHLEKQTPQTDAYASIFYTITSFHAAHVLVGLLMLLHVFARSLAGHFDEHRHLAVQNASLYWHFVDVVWLLIVGILYVSPHFYG